MNGILYMDVSVFEDVLLYEKGKTLLSAERRMYIEKLKNQKAARLSLGAGVLLFFALQKCNYTEQLEKIKKTPLGKPYLKGIDFQFNLSHSGTYALCAYSNRNIGADLQQIKEKLPEKTEKILSKDETSFLTKFTQPEQTQLFYRLWARKESLIKWDGRGLRLPLQEISFIKNGTLTDILEWEDKTLYFKEYPKINEKYAVCICKEGTDFARNAEEITAEMLKIF